jgi:hypothetical protein
MQVFDFLRKKNIVMWNARLNGLGRNELQEKATQMFQYVSGVEAWT